MKRASFAIAFSALGISLSQALDLSAQEPIRPPSRFIPRLSAAGAFDARNSGRGDPEMYLGLATLEWKTGVTGLALRVDGIYARRDRINRSESLCGPTCDPIPGIERISFLSSKVTAAGAMVGATYDLRHRGSFRPYVLGSGGVVQTHDRFAAGTSIFKCAATLCALANWGDAVTRRDDRPISAAAHVGTGVVYSWPWISVFAEARYMAVDYANTRGLNGAVPISLGLRF